MIPRRAGARVTTGSTPATSRVYTEQESSRRSECRAPAKRRSVISCVREDIKDDRRKTQHRLKAFLMPQGRRYPGRDKGLERRVGPVGALPALRRADRRCRVSPLPRRARRPKDPARHHHYRGRGHGRGRAARRTRGQAPVPTRDRDALGRQHHRRGLRFRRFPGAPSFMAFTRLVPSEHSSGPPSTRVRSPTGNAHVSRVLVEVAWSYRHRPSIGVNLQRRSEGQSPEVLAYAWGTQCRLYFRFHSIARTKNRDVAVVAVARELSGFLGGLMTDHIE
jgi:transposase